MEEKKIDKLYDLLERIEMGGRRRHGGSPTGGYF